MKKIGIICEYNPFHNGHLYHLKEIKRLYPDSLIVLILGSYFLQRGETSLISKWNKTKIALDYGIDLVLELPTLYGTNSADYFAYYAVKALSIAQVDVIVFGSETADISKLKEITNNQESSDFDDALKSELKKGTNYPTSLAKTLGVTLKSNDLLAVSYLKAISKLHPSIEAIAIRRTNDFNDTSSDEDIISASNIRKKLQNGQSIQKHVPSYNSNYINEVDEEKLFQLLKYRIVTDDHLERYLGVDEGIENKLKKEIFKADSLEDFIDKIKSKRYTTARIRRLLIHILLGIEKTDMDEGKNSYRILGFSSKGKKYLKFLKTANLSTKLDDRSEQIEKKAAFVYYELTKDESIKLESQNKPLIK